jgi:hypothetical protein
MSSKTTTPDSSEKTKKFSTIPFTHANTFAFDSDFLRLYVIATSQRRSHLSIFHKRTTEI